MDLNMPVMRGDTAARQLRDRGFNGVIVAVTGNEMADGTLKEIGMDDVINKPFDLSQLKEKIRSSVAKRTDGVGL